MGLLPFSHLKLSLRPRRLFFFVASLLFLIAQQALLFFVFFLGQSLFERWYVLPHQSVVRHTCATEFNDSGGLYQIGLQSILDAGAAVVADEHVIFTVDEWVGQWYVAERAVLHKAAVAKVVVFVGDDTHC
jgi:hypothetical protein